MNFNYQLYVNRLKYEPYQWPPDISLAQLHSRVSEQGPINQMGVKCPCCSYQSKKSFKNWWSRDIAEDCSKLGSSVPAFFGLLKFYIFSILLAILINGIYPLWAMDYTCRTYHSMTDKQDSCLKVGALYYLNFDYQLDILLANNEDTIAQNLVILQTVTYYMLTLVNLGSLWYLFYMEKKEEQLCLQHTQAARNALIVGNLPELDIVKMQEKLNVETKLQIVEVVPLKEVKKYYQLFHKRNTIFYRLLSRYVQSEDPRHQKKLNNTLTQLHKRLKAQKFKLSQSKYNHLLIVFKTSYMASAVYNNYSLSAVKKVLYGVRSLIQEMGISKEISQLPLYTLRVPSVKEIKWENVGETVRSSLAGRIKSFLLAVGIIALLLVFFQEPMRYSLETHTKEKLSDIQKAIPFLVSFLLFGVSVAYRNYMVQVSKRKNPLNEYQAAKFVLISSMLFHIIFYIITPVLFFAVDDGIDRTVKLFVISQQARTFVVMQLILCIIDIPYQLWKSRKIKCLGDQRQGFKYNQQMLHRVVEYRDFPLQLRLQVMFRIWSLAMFYSFYLPYIMYYMLVALSILYFLQKRNFYLHYTLRRSITLQLEKAFLTYFVNFFCAFQLFSYCLSTYSSQKYPWTLYTSVPITITLLLLNLLFWACLQPKLKQQKQKKQQGIQEQLLQQKVDKAQQDLGLAYAKQVGNEYKQSYNKFLNSINQEKLDQQVDEYLSGLSKDNVEGENEDVKIEKIIQMAESQFDEAHD